MWISFSFILPRLFAQFFFLSCLQYLRTWTQEKKIGDDWRYFIVIIISNGKRLCYTTQYRRYVCAKKRVNGEKEARKDRHRRRRREKSLANEFRVRLLVLLKGRFMRSKMIMLKICKFSINLHRMHAYWMWKDFFCSSRVFCWNWMLEFVGGKDQKAFNSFQKVNFKNSFRVNLLRTFQWKVHVHDEPKKIFFSFNL